MVMYINLYIVKSNDLCPTNVAPDNCTVECYNDSQCASNQVCCGNGCGQTCIDHCLVSPKTYTAVLYSVANYREIF